MKRDTRQLIFFSILLLLFSAGEAHAQYMGDRKIWHLGAFSALDFGSYPPTYISGSQINSDYASAVMNTLDGNLLFYTEGENVWDRFGAAMPGGYGLNGRSGLISTRRGVVIVPVPEDSNKYYIFICTVSVNNGGLPGLCYTLVDMQQNSGKGAVVTSTKNVKLFGPSTEKVSAIKHANGTDYWVVSQEQLSNKFYSYLVSAAGVGSTPVTSVSSYTTTYQHDDMGSISFSPDGTKMACVNGRSGTIELFNFNRATGQLSNMRLLTISGGAYIKVDYSCFSPNSRYLYISSSGDTYLKQLDTWDTSATHMVSNAYNLPVVFHSFGMSPVGDMVLAPDKNLYIARLPKALSRIANPDTTGPACGYTDSLALWPTGPTGCVRGLPNFVNRGLGPQIVARNRCVGDTIFFRFYSNYNPDSVRWFFGESTPSASNTSSSLNTFHQYQAAGSYTVKLYLYSYGNIVDSGVYTHTAYAYPSFTLGPDTFLCPGKTIQLKTNINPFGNLHTWNTNAISSGIQVNSPGTYWVRVFNNKCYSYDTIRVFPDTATFAVNLGKDTFVCSPGSIQLDAGHTNAHYLWNTGDTLRFKTVDTAGVYTVTVTRDGFNCPVSDNITVLQYAQPAVSLGSDRNLCYKDSAVIDLRGKGYQTIHWQDNKADSFYTIKQSGVYAVKVSANGKCYAMDTLVANVDTAKFKVNLGRDTTLCGGGAFLLDGGYPAHGYSYKWNTGDSIALLITNISGTYSVVVNRPGYNCAASDTVVLQFFSLPQINLGSDTHMCYGKSLSIDLKAKGYKQVHWQDNSNDSNYKITQSGVYIATVTGSGNCINSDTLVVTIDSATFVVNLGADTNRCNGDVQLLDVGYTDATYLWHDNSTQRTFVATQTATCYVHVARPGFLCQVTDTIRVDFHSKPIINLGADQQKCTGDTIEFNLSGKGYSGVLWQDGDRDSIYIAQANGMYRVTVNNAYCSNSDTIQLFFHTVADPGLQGTYNFCSGDSVSITLGPTIKQALWQDSSTSLTRYISKEGSYLVHYSDSLCSDQRGFTVALGFPPQYDLPSDTIMCEGEHITLKPGVAGAQYLWQDGSVKPEFNADAFGIYYVRIKNNCGEHSDTTEVLDCACVLYVPDAFSPNADGHNDKFNPEGCLPRYYHLTIYNRWGQKVFETNSFFAHWDGTFRGEPAPAGVYAWSLEYTLNKRSTSANKALSGNLTLLR